MSALRWTHSRNILTLHISGEKPVIVRGDRAEELVNQIRSYGDAITEHDARAIYDAAQVSPVRRLINSDRQIVKAMNSAGIRNVGYTSGKVTFAGKPIVGALGRHLKRVIESNEHDLDSVNWSPIANFFNRLDQNVTASNELFHWLSVNDFSIASDGRVIAYKGVRPDYLSEFSGVGGWITDTGESFYSPSEDMPGYKRNKRLSYAPGNTVYMRRTDCDPNSDVHCSTGIHFGTQDYADNWGQVTMLCLVDPEDVVSIPSDDYRKARASRVEVIGELSRRATFVEEPIVDVSENPNGTPVLYDATSTKEIENREPVEIHFNDPEEEN